MDAQAEQIRTDDAAAARERVRRQKESLAASAGWLLNIIEYHAALLAPEGASAAVRLRRGAPTLGWSSPQQERLAVFAEIYAALDEEAGQALTDESASAETLTNIALRLEQSSSDALGIYVAIQADAQRAEELGRTTAADENQPSRLRARAAIGAGVRARLPMAGAQKIPTVGLELYRARNFMTAAECDALIELIERDLIPSGLLGDNGDPLFRTSKSCNLSASEPAVSEFEDRISLLAGINRRFGETVQGQRYEVGQQFKPHFDFFHAQESYYSDAAARGAQRTWTGMLFLNRPDGGGNTDFPTAGVSVAPERGTLLIWNNVRPDGHVNDFALHHGTPVLAGRKYVLTKWFRERPWLY